ncbi:hypothetical protein L0B53_13880 [Vibrio sp. SS-MA-C1-2]|uniref:hypothetical protein n=1 Tax=Vibrio sp. SS-MA-C1-2 TaxID=2908646 RepID=UPI001F37F004|nr:hypothetical protein [Vibrio sp. SS-MA-C1-2]UJF18103.1 hypothetical protein L0B53_13880 [Vibrio sp. SS-MA-C1-2]
MLITMSNNEINRFKVLQDVLNKRLKQTDAAKLLNLSTRQIRRLLIKLQTNVASGLAHGQSGKSTNHWYHDNFRYFI